MQAARIPFTVSDDASHVEATAVIRAALEAVWRDLISFDIDLSGLLDTTATATTAQSLQQYRTSKFLGRGLSENVRLLPGRHDEALPAALTLVGHTIGSSGYAEPGGLIFDANDEGTSCWFELTAEQASGVMAALDRAGHPQRLLVRAQK